MARWHDRIRGGIEAFREKLMATSEERPSNLDGRYEYSAIRLGPIANARDIKSSYRQTQVLVSLAVLLCVTNLACTIWLLIR